MMNLIRVLDFETSDEAPPEGKVIEAGFCDVLGADGAWSVGGPTAWLCGGVEKIAPAARAAHHLRVSDLTGQAPFDICCGLLGAHSSMLPPITVFAAHNAEFEQKFYTADKPWLCTYKAALRIWPDAPSHGNFALGYWLEDQGLIEYDAATAHPSHRAGPDAYMTAHILRELLKHATANEMVRWTKEFAVLPRCPIGKFRGKPWAEVESGFLLWMTRQPDMDMALKWNADREIQRRKNG
jgi:exodeoxyribonuclease X